MVGGGCLWAGTPWVFARNSNVLHPQARRESDHFQINPGGQWNPGDVDGCLMEGDAGGALEMPTDNRWIPKTAADGYPMESSGN